MTKFIVENAVCLLCSNEYLAEMVTPLIDMPLNQKKTQLLERFMREASEQKKTCISFNGMHICQKHLQEMIDALYGLS